MSAERKLEIAAQDVADAVKRASAAGRDLGLDELLKEIAERAAIDAVDPTDLQRVLTERHGDEFRIVMAPAPRG